MITTLTRPDPMPILLVEDNPAHAELIQRGLEDHRLPTQVYHVSDGKAALKYLFRQDVYADVQQSPRPFIILLDLRLPRIDGLDVLKRIKSTEELKHIPVVVLTTSSSQRDIATAYAWQANSYLVKPADFEKFMGLIEAMGSYWLEWNQKAE